MTDPKFAFEPASKEKVVEYAIYAHRIINARHQSRQSECCLCGSKDGIDIDVKRQDLNMLTEGIVYGTCKNCGAHTAIAFFNAPGNNDLDNPNAVIRYAVDLNGKPVKDNIRFIVPLH